MTWTKLSDDYSDDCWTLSDAAFRLHTEALVWSNRKLLDCVIPADDLRRFAKNPEAAPELVNVGWWVLTDDGFYVIRHHATYQRTREAVLNQQSTNATNGAKGGRPRKPGRERHGTPPPSETESLSESETETDGTGRDWTGLDVEASTSARDDDSEHDSWSSSFDPEPAPEDDDGPTPEDLAAPARDGWVTPSAPVAPPPDDGPPEFAHIRAAAAALGSTLGRRAGESAGPVVPPAYAGGRAGTLTPMPTEQVAADPGYCPRCGMTLPRHTRSCPTRKDTTP